MNNLQLTMNNDGRNEQLTMDNEQFTINNGQ